MDESLKMKAMIVYIYMIFGLKSTYIERYWKMYIKHYSIYVRKKVICNPTYSQTISKYYLFMNNDKSGWDKRIRVCLKFKQKVSNQWRR